MPEEFPFPPPVHRPKGSPVAAQGNKVARAHAHVGFDESDVDAIARYQKCVIGCIAIYLLAVVGLLAAPQLEVVFRAVFVITAFAGMVSTGFLASKLSGAANGVILAVMTIVPFFGLLILFYVNKAATEVLKECGRDVRMFGVK